MYDFMLAYSNFRLENYSQEELELFGSKCSKQLLLAIGMIRFVGGNNNTGKTFGFKRRELGSLCESASKMIMGVNLNGGYDNYCEVIDDFLLTVKDLDEGKPNSVKKDLKFAIAKEMRDITISSMNKQTGYWL